MLRFSLLAVLGAVLTATAAHADTTYVYNGLDYTTATGDYTTSMSITGTLTLTAPLGANMSYSDPVGVVSYSFFDGVRTITSTDGSSSDIEFMTNNAGAITGIYINLFFPNGGGVLQVTEGGAYSTNYGDSLASVSGPVLFTLQPTATPEPSSIALLGTGVLGLAGAVRRRRV